MLTRRCVRSAALLGRLLAQSAQAPPPLVAAPGRTRAADASLLRGWAASGVASSRGYAKAGQPPRSGSTPPASTVGLTGGGGVRAVFNSPNVRVCTRAQHTHGHMR